MSIFSVCPAADRQEVFKKKKKKAEINQRALPVGAPGDLLSQSFIHLTNIY
jgi:hypothetical protein